MDEIRNLSGKRVCDVSEDRRVVIIRIRDCITMISANADGTLKIEQDKVTI